MFGMPSIQIIMLTAVAPVLIAFSIVNYKENIYSVATWFVVCITDLLVMSGYFPFMYKSLYSEDDTPKPIEPMTPRKTLIDFNGVYSQDAIGIRIDSIRLFNRTLLTQRNGNLEVNLSEGFWLKRTEGMEENRWNAIGGAGPTDFRTMLERGERFGAYRQAGGQNKWIVNDWQKVRRLEQGQPLPRYPPPPLQNPLK